MQEKSIYEITDPATGEKWEVSTVGELTDEDVQNVMRAVGSRPSPRVDSVTLTGGKPLAAKKGSTRLPASASERFPAPPLGDSQDPLRARFGLDRELPGASAALVRGTEPLADSLRRSITAPALVAGTLGDIGLQGVSDLAQGRPLMSTDPKSAGARLGDLAFSLVPLRQEGEALINGGVPAALDTLGKHFARDPFDLLLQGVAARGLMKSPAVRTLGDVSKAAMTSLDLSAVGRQGLPLAVTHPGRVVPALGDMVKAGLSETGAQQVAARARRPMGSPSLPPPPLVAEASLSPVPSGGVPPLFSEASPVAVAKAPRVPTGAPPPAGPTRPVELPSAPVPQAPPLVQSSAEARNLRPIQTKPGVYRVPSELLDELLNPPTSAAGALDRATRPDALAPIATPGTVQVPDLRPGGSPVVPPVAEAPPVAGSDLSSPPMVTEPVPVVATPAPRPSPEAFGLDLSSSELFRGSKTLESIPVVGKLFAPGRRAFDSYLQSLRRGAFDDMAAKLEEQGLSYETHPELYRDAATWVNRLSGSGDAGPIPKPVADLMFAPKLTASRFELLNPSKYLQLAPEVRKVAVRDALAATGAGLGTLWMASRIPGVKVGTDPEDSATFGKITLADGKTHYDIWGGMLPYARLAALALTGSEKTGPAASKRLESMLAPLPSYGLDAMRGTDFTGQELDPLGGLADRFTPLVLQDMRDAIKEKGAAGVLTASPSILGVGVQTYESKKGEPRR